MRDDREDPARPPGGDHAPPPVHRERVIEALCDAYARDRIGTRELERRLDRANRARSGRELRELVEDLDLPELHPTGEPPARPAEAAGDGEGLAASTGAGRVDASRVPDRQLLLAFWSGRGKEGSWIPARNVVAIAFQGGIELDFREALFGPGVTDIRATAVMGAVEIIVPPGLHLETSGFAILGAFEDQSQLAGPPTRDAPTLRVRGTAIMGAVEVTVRLPGESAGEARGRLRRERREARKRALRDRRGS